MGIQEQKVERIKKPKVINMKKQNSDKATEVEIKTNESSEKSIVTGESNEISTTSNTTIS